MNIRKKIKQLGFTLIELVIVIVILGILAAIAIPRFADLSESAQNAAAAGFEGAVKSSFAIYIAENHFLYWLHTICSFPNCRNHSFQFIA